MLFWIRVLASSSLKLMQTLPIAGFVPDSSPGASSYFSPQRMEQETNETFEVLFSAQRNPVIAGLDAEIARNPFRHRSRSSSFHSSPSTHLQSPLSKTVIKFPCADLSMYLLSCWRHGRLLSAITIKHPRSGCCPHAQDWCASAASSENYMNHLVPQA